jgi:hypothetical protein
MTTIELREKLTTKLGIEKIHPLHDAMIEECCENVLKTIGQTDDTYILSVQIGFMTALTTLKGLVEASLNYADTITLNYRGQTFVIDKESPILLSI